MITELEVEARGDWFFVITDNEAAIGDRGSRSRHGRRPLSDGKHGRPWKGVDCQRLSNGGLWLHCREGGLEDAAYDQAVGLASGDREAHGATLPGRKGRSATVLGFAPRSQRSLR